MTGIPPPPPAPVGPAPSPGDTEGSPFRVWEGVAFLGWTIVAQLIVGIVAAVVLVASAVTTGGSPPDFTELLGSGSALLALAAATQVVTMFGLLAYLGARGRINLPTLLGPARPTRGHALLGLGLGLASFVGIVTLVAVVQSVTGYEPETQAALDATRDDATAIVLGVVVAVGLAPLLEEFVFRGALFDSVRARRGLHVGVAQSSVAFAAVHIELVPFDEPLSFAVFLALLAGTVVAVWLLPPEQSRMAVPLAGGGLLLAVGTASAMVGVTPFSAVSMLGLFLLGVILALSYARTRSLIVPVVAHATFNAISLALFVAVGS